MLFSSMIAVFILLSVGHFSEAKKCPTITTQKDFDVTKYTGVWYELYRNTIIFELGSKCVNATYTLRPDGSVGVLNQAINLLGGSSTITGTASVKNSAEPGALSVAFDNPKQVGDYNVISTNYNDYALVYSCRDIPVIGRWEFMWILARTKTLPASVVDNLKKTLTQMGVDADKFKPTNQNC